MALIKIEPYIIDSTGDFTFNNVNATGNLSSLNANLGNAATANYFIGSGANLTNLPAGNISGQVGNALVAGTVYTAAQPNITSVGTLTGLTSNGTVDFANTSNTTLGAVGNVHITGGSSGQYLQTDGSGTLSWATVTSGSTSNISNGNSNVNIPSANGNINLTAVGNTTMVVTGTGANIAGTLNATGNIAGGGELNITGNSVVSGNLTVNGTLTYINSTTLSISDPIINLQTGANGAAPASNTGKDVGTALNYYDTSAKIAWMGWDVSNAEIAFGSNVGISSEVVTFTSLANIRSGNANLGNNVSANFFTGNGIYLTGITTAGLSNGNSNVNIPSANGNINLTAVGNTTMVITGTGVNVAGTFNASGNLSAGNISAGSGSGGSITGGNLVSANYFTGTLTTAAQPNITSVGSLTGLTVSNATGVVNFTTTANVTLGAVGNLHISGGTNAYVLSTDGAGNLSWVAQSGGGGGSNIANGNSNVSIASSNGNITMSAVGNANIVVVTGTGLEVTGTANVSGNLSAGNISAGSGSGGSITGGNLVSANYFTGTLTTAAQPNITSVGSLTGLTVSNSTGVVNFTTTANVTLGAVGNLHISGGTANYVLSTDGAGNLSWAEQTGGNAANVTVDSFTGNGVQTVFTLSTTPIGINQTSINYNGATVLRSDYTLANANITFSSAPADGSLIEVTTINLTSGGGGTAAAVGYSLIFGG